ncbi:unnamed protein product [Angiostrongylus costaricensis]|uniref:Helitron_like_N domain-containing protein n=1 Tax=Angiostrongylus costaricensis TaxID=334426 RepID=A0A0R3PZX2_ANGCS|nr:unnamed protein product [Angiostrongylus costaricensis]
MNIYTPAGGLFQTHVTWEDIETDMKRELDTVASFGPNKIAKDIGDGNGFMSKILLIDPDWQHKDKELPEKFVVKTFIGNETGKTFKMAIIWLIIMSVCANRLISLVVVHALSNFSPQLQFLHEGHHA